MIYFHVLRSISIKREFRGRELNQSKLFPLPGDIFVLVFSMDSRESFEEVQRLREQILETKYSASLPQTQGTKVKKVIPKVPMVIAGNKCDKDMK